MMPAWYPQLGAADRPVFGFEILLGQSGCIPPAKIVQHEGRKIRRLFTHRMTQKLHCGGEGAIVAVGQDDLNSDSGSLHDVVLYGWDGAAAGERPRASHCGFSS
jgi:hypothetical protein